MNKKVLYISNMYPSKKYKHYGIFVYNMEKDMEKLGYQLDKVVKTKQDFIFFKIISYLWFYTKVLLKSLFKNYDIIYVHFISHSARTLIKKKARLFLHAHGNDIIPDSKKDEKNLKHSQKALNKADKVIVPSTYFKEVLEKNYHVDKSRIEIYPSGGIHFDRMKSINQKEAKKIVHLEDNYQYIGMVSRIEKDKGWDTLLEAIYLLKQRGSFENKKVLIIGSGEEDSLLEEKIKEYQLEKEILRRPFVSQEKLAYYYNAIDVLVFPTKRKSESLGLVGLEAMACKTPIIVCTMYGPRTYASKENAITYEEPSGEVLASKIQDFYEMNDKERKEMISLAYTKAREYDSNLLLNRLQTILK